MWYDLFSLVYDRALEDLYAPFRPAAVAALHLTEGDRVIDLPCGTGQSLDGLVSAVGPTGRVIGVDASRGMLRKAQHRVDRAGWKMVSLVHATAAQADPARLGLDGEGLDGVLCALGLTALPHWEDAFDRLFALLRPGGRFVLFDVHAAERTVQTRSVELVAQADLGREVWRPLKARCVDAEREILPADPATFGGDLYVASGTKPG